MVAAAGIAVGAFVLARGDDQTDLATRYGQAFARGDYAGMYAQLSASDRRALTVERFAELQREARETATVTRIRTGLVTEAEGDRYRVPVTVDTRLFGQLKGDLLLPIVKDGSVAAVDWSQALSFPGLRAGEKLSRTTTLPTRADLLASDGTVLVKGADRVPNSDPALSSIVGQMGPIPDDQKSVYAKAGVPADASVGLTGLERVFESRLRGQPGGTLLAGDREIASAEPVEASNVRTTIQPSAQKAAVEALAGRLGGIAVVKPSNGAILGLAGAAFSGLQPPGSTFKIITATAGLQHDAAKPTTTYPVETAATLSGVELQNADGESCGGTLVASFEHSCNSVFAPLGAKVGAKDLVATAEEFGFNQDLGIPGAAISTIPSAEQLGDDDLVLGSTAIGQGQVQATALQMALVAATIGERGQRPTLTLEAGKAPERKRVMPKEVGSDVAAMMAGVVSRGTGALAKIDGVKVAGKTGTAELRTTQGECDPENPPPGGCPDADDTTDTTAWFAGYAPAGSPKVAVAVQLPGQGKGGDTAAPAFRDVVAAVLK